MLREAPAVVAALLRGPAGPNITPPKVSGFHPDPKLVGAAAAAAIIATVIIAAWRALPKWLLVIAVLGVLAALGIAAVHLGGTTVDHSGVHR